MAEGLTVLSMGAPFWVTGNPIGTMDLESFDGPMAPGISASGEMVSSTALGASSTRTDKYVTKGYGGMAFLISSTTRKSSWSRPFYMFDSSLEIVS